jgi:hypothetical protein
MEFAPIRLPFGEVRTFFAEIRRLLGSVIAITSVTFAAVARVFPWELLMGAAVPLPMLA